jgi:hypothetical protein
MLLAVNFHYIQPERRCPYPGIYLTATEYRSLFFDENILVERGGM